MTSQVTSDPKPRQRLLINPVALHSNPYIRGYMVKRSLMPSNKKWARQATRTTFDSKNPNGKSCVPLVKTGTVKAEGVGGWGYDPTWAGSKQEGLNMGEIRVINDLDRKRKEDKRNPPSRPAIVKAPSVTRTLLGHKMESIFAKYR